MKLKATDTLHISSIQDRPLQKDEQFEMSDESAAKSLIARGLATEVKAKAEASVKNKAEPKLTNKAAG
jgi:hypothetical protein